MYVILSNCPFRLTRVRKDFVTKEQRREKERPSCSTLTRTGAHSFQAFHSSSFLPAQKPRYLQHPSLSYFSPSRNVCLALKDTTHAGEMHNWKRQRKTEKRGEGQDGGHCFRCLKSCKNKNYLWRKGLKQGVLLSAIASYHFIQYL